MSGAWVAFWIGIGAPTTLYLTKRLLDYVLPPGRHWPWLDRFSTPNKEEVEEE